MLAHLKADKAISGRFATHAARAITAGGRVDVGPRDDRLA